MPAKPYASALCTATLALSLVVAAPPAAAAEERVAPDDPAILWELLESKRRTQAHTEPPPAPTPGALPRPLNRGTYSVAIIHRISQPVAASPTTSRFGHRECSLGPCSTFHKGVDLTPGEGAAVKSVAAGTVVAAGWDGDYGNKVAVEHYIDGESFTTIYAHLQHGSIPVYAGQVIPRGERLGAVGNTGQSYGAHLHFEVHIPGRGPVDPWQWIAAHDVLPYPE